MIFAYDFDRLNNFLGTVLKESLKPEGWKWLENEVTSVRTRGDLSRFNIAFVAMPRRTGKDVVNLSEQERSEAQALRKGLTIAGWTTDRLARVWLLMQLSPADKEKYFAAIENLFLSAEMGELVALYSSLPLLAYPEMWRKRCAEGIRNNIGLVLESVICNNPYPSEQLDEAAWNQMILKAIFTEKPMLEIAGLEERMNASLAQSLTDYAHERWAAQRPVNPLLWICVRPFINKSNFSDIQRLFDSADPAERQAAALVCYRNPYEPASQLLARNKGLETEVAGGKVTWASLAAGMNKQ